MRDSSSREKEMMLGKLAPLVDWIVGAGEYANEESICTRIARARCKSSNSKPPVDQDGRDNNIEMSDEEEQEHEDDAKEEQKERLDAHQGQLQVQHNSQQQVEQPPNGSVLGVVCKDEAEGWIILDDHFT